MDLGIKRSGLSDLVLERCFAMALVTPIPAMGERAGSMRFHGIGSPGSRSSRSGIMDEPVSRLIEEKIFVAVDKHVAKSKSTLIWALQNTGGKKICLIHVHQPSQMIPVSKYLRPFLCVFCPIRI